MSKNKTKIEILNPLPGGMRFTSQERAEKFLFAGLGVMRGKKFEFFEACQEKRLRQQDDEYERQKHSGNVDGEKFEIRIADGWRYPHTQWVRKVI